MASSEKQWKTMARSQFSWEQEALDFIHERFPGQDNYRAWANFEFIADDGSINDVDVLVACPQGIFLIEIKSNPGHLWGDAQDWTWHHEGRRKTVENPLILANRKCKRLKALLSRQKAFRDGNLFIEPLVFLSHPEAKSHLTGNATFGVTFRDAESPAGDDIRPGIMAAIRRRECPGLRQYETSPVNRPQIKAITQAMEQAGIKPSQKTRKVGDFILDELVFDSPTGLYQDWLAHHVSHPSTRRCARIAPREALAIVPQICDALQYAHDASVVHRDIKPDNILLDRQGRVKVADFGLAKIVAAVCDRRTISSQEMSRPEDPPSVDLTEAGKIMGTPQYMAPEQTAHPSEVDHRADIYSLGVVFYQMLTGELPAGQSFAPPSKRVLVDVRLDEVVLRALEKEPARRYQQASMLKTRVETIAATPQPLDRKTGFQPVREDSASRLSASETTGWKPVAQTIFSHILQGIAVFDPMKIR